MLNPYQKNALEIQLRQLEQTLVRVRSWLRQVPEDGLLTHYQALPEAARPEIEAVIEQMLAEIGLLVEKFELRPRVVDLRRTLQAEMGVAWSDLIDTLSPKLARYGAVDTDLGESLDPHLRRLVRWSNQLGQLAERAPVPPARGQGPGPIP
jgi:hypothetical protein